MKKGFIRTVALILVFSMCLAFASCGKKKKKKPNYGGSVTVGITHEPMSFDPHTPYYEQDREVLSNIYESLLTFDWKGELKPCLATEYSVSPDARSYTFTIREDVRFNDGTELDPSDVVYSVKRAAGLLDPANDIPVDDALSVITDATIDPEGRVVVTLDSPDSELLELYMIAIIPDGANNIGETMIGTGPFKFASREEGQTVTLVKNDDYRVNEKPYLDSVTFKIFPDVASAFPQLISGEIDILPYISTETAMELDPEQFSIHHRDSNRLQILALNNEAAPFDDIRVRQAINYALDRDEIISVSSYDGVTGEPLTTAMSPIMVGAYDPSLNGTYARDLTTARALMTQAGYPDGFDMTITIPDNDAKISSLASVIADQLSSIDIRVTIQSLSEETWYEDTFTNRDYESAIVTISDPFDPYEVISRYEMHSDDNLINYSNALAERLIQMIPLTADEETRTDLYHQLLKIITDDAASCYLQDQQYLGAVNKRVGGYHIYPMYIQNMSTVYIK